MPKLKLKDNVSKVCVVLYNMNDVRRCVDFAKKYNFYYYYIEHKPGNEDLKVHYHVIIESDSYHRFVISSLVSETATINLFSKCDSVSAYLRYMLHLDYIDKEKYDVSDIVSNNSIDNINKMVAIGSKKQSEINNENFVLLLQLISECNFSNLNDVVIFCLNNNIKYSTNWTFTFKCLLNEQVKKN